MVLFSQVLWCLVIFCVIGLMENDQREDRLAPIRRSLGNALQRWHVCLMLRQRGKGNASVEKTLLVFVCKMGQLLVVIIQRQHHLESIAATDFSRLSRFFNRHVLVLFVSV